MKTFIMIIALCWLSLAYPVISLAGSPSEEELTKFVDSYFEEKLDEYHVPGAVVSIVEGDEVRVLKGYGYSNLEKQTPANPEETVFRLGSIAKVFTASAVMQLVESEKLNLHKDIKMYDSTLEIKYMDNRPITLHHLLTHTGGFYEKITGVGKDKEKQLPLSEAVQKYLPNQVRPPGQEISYSNQGMSLAGYLVEKVSRKKYEQYMEEFVFKPLDMQNSSYRPDEESHSLARSYHYDKNSYVLAPYEYVHHLPSGSLQSTAEDMSHFMIAHLQKGKFKSQKLFAEETATLMHSRQFTPNQAIPGMAYGFNERFQNGLRIIEHDGGIDGFNSIVHLVPEKNIGIFIATNSNTGSQIIEGFIIDFLNVFFPSGREKADVRENPTPAKKLEHLRGFYVPNRTMIEGPFQFAQNLSTSKLTVKNDGIITIENGGESKIYVEIKPYVFQERDGSELIYLDKDNHTFASSTIPTMLYHQKPAYYHPMLHLILLGNFVLVYPIQLLTAFILQGYSFIRRNKITFPWDMTLVSILFILYFLFAISSPEILANSEPIWSYLLIYLPVIIVSLLISYTIWQLIRKKSVRHIGYYAFVAVTTIFTIYMYAWDFFKI